MFPGVKTGLVEPVGFLDCGQGLARDLKLLLQLPQREVFRGDLGHESNLRVAPRFRCRQIFFERLGVQAAHMPEEVQFVRRCANVGAPLGRINSRRRRHSRRARSRGDGLTGGNAVIRAGETAAGIDGRK